MKELYYKVVRDPVYSEVFLSPLEIIISDTPNMQRLRYLSQLVGAEYVYPSATHTRFGHSVGVMHLSGLYAQHLYPYDYSKFRVLRLAGLMHDIGHGPYSHQFDDTVYKTMGYKDGHDEFRTRIIRGKLLEDTLSVYKNSSDPRIKNDFIHDIELTLGIQTNEDNIHANLQEIFEKVIQVYEGENTGSVDFNIVQGPLGADRLDFV
ncbi:MAG TPA: HD domain-containing protein, partial [Petrotogaceae bacterium]|nr:HD domain-containing protein [Petrotogaceae bacterium]